MISLHAVPSNYQTVKQSFDFDIPDSKAELEKCEDEWSNTERAKAIHFEIARRLNSKRKEHGFLNVWPSEEVNNK